MHGEKSASGGGFAENVVPGEPPVRRQRLAVVGATYAFVETRKKIDALAEHFDIVCITSESYTCYGLENHVADQPKPTTYRLVALPVLGRPETTTRYFLRGLGEVLRQAEPEIVLVESEPWAWLRWQTWWHARRLKLPVHFGEFSWENIRRFGIKGLILSAVYRAAAATADFVIGGNTDAGQFFVEAGLPPDRLLIAPQLGVDETIFHPVDAATKATRRRALGLPEDAFIVGFSGRLVEMKGVPDLIRAVELLRSRAGGDGIHLALLGPGEIAPLLKGYTAQPEWLHVRPAVVHAEMARFMQSLDLYVLPSREWRRDGVYWREQFGHVLIEAMACGIPTLGSSSGAIPAVLGDQAQIFPEGDVERLSELLSAFFLSPEARNEAIGKQIKRVHENYTNSILAWHWAKFLRRKTQSAGPAQEG